MFPLVVTPMLPQAAPHLTTTLHFSVPGYKVQSVLHCFLVKFNLCVIYFTALTPHPPLTTTSPPPLIPLSSPALR